MGVYIMGMEMPTSCQKCPFLDYEEGFCFASGAKGKSGWYEFTLRPGEIKDRRHDDCPIIHVPPHGRLIDADALEVVVESHYKHHKISRYERDLLLHYLDVEMAPTVIPASEESET